jgi:hypothetical protein
MSAYRDSLDFALFCIGVLALSPVVIALRRWWNTRHVGPLAELRAELASLRTQLARLQASLPASSAGAQTIRLAEEGERDEL